MAEILFPSRPNPHGVRTPDFPTPDPTPIRGVDESLLQQQLEVVVLRPTIRPPSYDEVVASTASPARFSAANNGSHNNLSSDSLSSGAGFGFSTTRLGGNNNNNNAAAATAGNRGLPSPMQTPGNFGVNSAAASAYNNNNNNTSAVTTGTPFPARNNNDAANANLTRAPVALNKTTVLSEQQTMQGNNNGAASSSSPSPRRKLACWYADRTKGDDAIPSLKYRTVGDTVRGCLATNDGRPLSNAELRVDWKRICALRSGTQLYKLCPPYISRDEFADPFKDIQNAWDRVQIPCGYVTRERRDGQPGWEVLPKGYRPTARQNAEVALKPTEIDPYDEKITLRGSPARNNNNNNNNNNSPRAASAGGGRVVTTNYAKELKQQQQQQKSDSSLFAAKTGGKITAVDLNESRALRAASAVPLNRPASNPLTEEAERRLQQHGFGGLATVSRASDEAVSHLLKFCGFKDAERLAILWEVRKAQRAPARVM